MKGAIACATVALVLATAASVFFAFARTDAQSCRLETSGERHCQDERGETLVEQEGAVAIALLAVPVAMSLVVLLTVMRWSGWAIVPAVAFSILTLVSIASIGLFYLPSAVVCMAASLLARR